MVVFDVIFLYYNTLTESDAMQRYYNAYSHYLKGRFPWRVYKLPLDAGFNCPNRDGRVAVGGCTFCSNASFSPNSGGPLRSVRDQVDEGIAVYRKRRFGGEKFIAYFQAFTNTDAPVDRLAALYEEALSHPEIVGLAIATRPDCLPEPVLDLLSTLQKRTALFLEVGLQSSHDETLRRVNRGHTFADFVDAVDRIKRRGFYLSTHLILGLPGEDRTRMLETVERVAQLPVDAVKVTHLYIPRQAPLAQAYRRGELSLLTLPEYLQLVCDLLERLPARMIIERLMGELDGEDILAPRWGRHKGEILEMIASEFARRGTCQGILFREKPQGDIGCDRAQVQRCIPPMTAPITS
ncbi:MAG: TIGR01212 family radical SAM protein [Nitrospirae bacterium]|nr:TIGR01212 family radical SAM protein [Candidatus Manganitrophaceae bacterium]